MVTSLPQHVRRVSYRANMCFLVLLALVFVPAPILGTIHHQILSSRASPADFELIAIPFSANLIKIQGYKDVTNYQSALPNESPLRSCPGFSSFTGPSFCIQAPSSDVQPILAIFSPTGLLEHPPQMTINDETVPIVFKQNPCLTGLYIPTAGCFTQAKDGPVETIVPVIKQREGALVPTGLVIEQDRTLTSPIPAFPMFKPRKISTSLTKSCATTSTETIFKCGQILTNHECTTCIFESSFQMTEVEGVVQDLPICRLVQTVANPEFSLGIFESELISSFVSKYDYSCNSEMTSCWLRCFPPNQCTAKCNGESYTVSTGSTEHISCLRSWKSALHPLGSVRHPLTKTLCGSRTHRNLGFAAISVFLIGWKVIPLILTAIASCYYLYLLGKRWYNDREGFSQILKKRISSDRLKKSMNCPYCRLHMEFTPEMNWHSRTCPTLRCPNCDMQNETLSDLQEHAGCCPPRDWQRQVRINLEADLEEKNKAKGLRMRLAYGTVSRVSHVIWIVLVILLSFSWLVTAQKFDPGKSGKTELSNRCLYSRHVPNDNIIYCYPKSSAYDTQNVCAFQNTKTGEIKAKVCIGGPQKVPFESFVPVKSTSGPIGCCAPPYDQMKPGSRGFTDTSRITVPPVIKKSNDNKYAAFSIVPSDWQNWILRGKSREIPAMLSTYPDVFSHSAGSGVKSLDFSNGKNLLVEVPLKLKEYQSWTRKATGYTLKSQQGTPIASGAKSPIIDFVLVRPLLCADINFIGFWRGAEWKTEEHYHCNVECNEKYWNSWKQPAHIHNGRGCFYEFSLNRASQFSCRGYGCAAINEGCILTNAIYYFTSKGEFYSTTAQREMYEVCLRVGTKTSCGVVEANNCLKLSGAEVCAGNTGSGMGGEIYIPPGSTNAISVSNRCKQNCAIGDVGDIMQSSSGQISCPKLTGATASKYCSKNGPRYAVKGLGDSGMVRYMANRNERHFYQGISYISAIPPGSRTPDKICLPPAPSQNGRTIRFTLKLMDVFEIEQQAPETSCTVITRITHIEGCAGCLAGFKATCQTTLSGCPSQTTPIEVCDSVSKSCIGSTMAQLTEGKEEQITVQTTGGTYAAKYQCCGPDGCGEATEQAEEPEFIITGEKDQVFQKDEDCGFYCNAEENVVVVTDSAVNGGVIAAIVILVAAIISMIVIYVVCRCSKKKAREDDTMLRKISKKINKSQ
ncbi:glycoprotein [Wenling hagfish virus]|uniref:Glycoprotein n=1 Tax=Wenling hagfish virus TaxID=2116438 RepID=A0A2P1GNR2_9VIRU|nr:glycoprotein [Wenling hagfish virus]